MLHKVIVIGEMCEDILMHNPESVEVMGMKVWAEDITVTAGGSASYTSEALKHLGVDVNLCSVVGDDRMGKRLIDRMKNVGINCDMIKTLKNRKTTASMLICSKAEKEFLGCSPMLPIELPDIEKLKGVDMVYIAGYMLYPELWSDEAYAFFKELKKRNILLALDVQMQPVNNFDAMKITKFDRILPLIDVLFVAKKEADQIVGRKSAEEAGRIFVDLGCKSVVLKQGSDGAAIITGEGVRTIKNHPVDAYDTVGSGDVYGASFCYGLLNDWNIEKCGRFASVFTALSLKRYQEYKEYPSFEEVSEIIKI